MSRTNDKHFQSDERWRRLMSNMADSVFELSDEHEITPEDAIALEQFRATLRHTIDCPDLHTDPCVIVPICRSVRHYTKLPVALIAVALAASVLIVFSIIHSQSEPQRNRPARTYENAQTPVPQHTQATLEIDIAANMTGSKITFSSDSFKEEKKNSFVDEEADNIAISSMITISRMSSDAFNDHGKPNMTEVLDAPGTITLHGDIIIRDSLLAAAMDQSALSDNIDPLSTFHFTLDIGAHDVPAMGQLSVYWKHGDTVATCYYGVELGVWSAVVAGGIPTEVGNGVPEPRTFAILGTGLCTLYFACRRRRDNRR